MNEEEKVADLIRRKKVRLTQTTLNRDNLKNYYFKVNGYEITITHILNSNRQPIYRTNCTCIRGSLINPKYNCVCKHIRASEFFLINMELKKWKKYKER
jgi:hypothetical protein